MKFGCCTMMQSYDLLCETGFDYIELPAAKICAMDEAEFERLRVKINGGPLPCLAFNAYCPKEVVIAGPGYSAERAGDYARKCAERANALGVRSIGIGSPFSRNLPDGFDLALAGGQIREFIGTTAEEFGKYGIDVCVEALSPCYCNFIISVGEAVEIVRDVGRKNVYIVLDFYNMEQSGEGNLDFSEFMPYVRHVHMEDDAGSPFAKSFFRQERFPAHKSRVKKLAELGYRGNISVEIDIPADKEAARKSLALLREAYYPVNKASNNP